MTEKTENVTEPKNQFGFGITEETKGLNEVPFEGGLGKGILVDVKKEIIGKKEKKYLTVAFIFKSLDRIKTFRHTEFQIETMDDKYEKRMNGLSSRLKHIFETYHSLPAGGIGTNASSWDDFFDKIVLAFNTGNNGKPVYTRQESEKVVHIPVHLKLTYNDKNNIQFPLGPNFIEKITEANADKPKTLVIDKRYDKIEQTDTPKATSGVMGGAIPPTNDFGF